MSDDLERELRDALSAAASSAVGDHRQPPPFRPDVPLHHSAPPPRRRHSWLAPLLAAAAVVAVVGGSVAAATAFGHRRAPVAAPPHTGSLAAPSPSQARSAVPPEPSASPARVVSVASLEGDGETYGIAMPIVLWFDAMPTDSSAFLHAVKITVNGQPADGAWYWEKSARPGAAVEAHYRPESFWPGHATIQVELPIAGLSAGSGMVYGDKLTSVTFHTGPATIGTVNGATSKLTVTSDGKQVGVFPVAVGAPNTPTMDGTKVVMEKSHNEKMIGSGYDEIVKWAMRLTNSGEYLHAAPWNAANIKAGRPSSNGCTNMLPADAEKLFKVMEIGDPVVYTNMPGKDVQTMPSWDGYGDWNLAWSLWSKGGLLPDH